MKKILSLASVALGIVALTSCNSEEDFIDNQIAKDYSGLITLKVTEADAPEYIDGVNTRAFRAEDYTGTYVEGDVIRVYDDKLQKYNNFVHDGSKFVLKAGEEEYVTSDDFAYGLYYGDGTEGNVSYAGWKNGTNIALMNLPAEITYKESEGKNKAGENVVVYKAHLPQWGNVTKAPEGADYAFETSLSRLTAFAKVIFKNGADGTGITAVRARALKFATTGDKTAFDNAITEESKKLGDVVADDKYYGEGTNEATADDKKLNGWFEAELKTGGVLRATTDGSVNNATATNVITVNIENQEDLACYTNVVYIPIVPEKYDLLVFEYQKGSTWYFLRALEGVNVGTKGIGGMEEIFALAINDVESIKSLTDYLNYYKNEGDVELDVKNGTSTIACENHKVAQYYTIQIPNLKSDMTVNIKSNIDLANHKLVIADRTDEEITNTTKTFTINLTGFANGAAGSVDVKIDSKQPVVIGGDITSNDAEQGIEVAGGNVTFKDFKTGANIDITKATANVTIDQETASATSITKITNTEGAPIVINGGEVKTIQLVKNAAQTITMNGGKISTTIAAPTTDLTSSFVVTVNTSGAAEIVAAAEKTTGEGATAKNLTYSFNATWNDETKSSSATPQANIFTAAQLKASNGVAAPKLMGNVTIESGFSSIGLKSDATVFDGNKMTITGLTAPLFSNITSSSAALIVKDLTLSNANIAKNAAEQGILAAKATTVADKTITIQNVSVSGSVGAASTDSKNTTKIGGLIGNVLGAGTATFTDCQLNDVTVQGYHSLGGYIGELGGTAAVSFTKTAANKDALLSTVSIKKSYWTTDSQDDNCGKVGNFIGTISSTGAITVGDGTNAKAFGNFFTANKLTNTAVVDKSQAEAGYLEFGRNVNAEGKKYAGMEGQLFGYSTATVGTVTIYGYTTQLNGAAGNEEGSTTITNDNYINIFE